MLVADLFRHNLFPDFKLVGGSAGLGREITSVSVIDAPDVDRWMRGGELLVGSGYIFKTEQEDLIPFMTRASERNVAALGIKLDRYHHNLRDPIVQNADLLGLPLLQIPFRYRWTDINEAVYRQLEHDRREALSDQVPSGGMGDFWREGIEPKKILSQCASLTGRKIMASSNTLGLNHIFLPGGEIEGPDSLGERLRAPVVEKRALQARGQVAVRVEFRNQPPEWQAVYNLTGSFPLTIRLFLSGAEGTPSAMQEKMVLRAMSLLRVTDFESGTCVPDTSARRERFFEELCLDIYNDESMINANLEELNVTLSETSRVIVAVSDDDPPFEGWEPPEVPLSYRLGHFWTGLISCREYEDRRKDDKFFLKILKNDRGGKIYFALGSVIKKPGEISRSYQEASRMIGWIRSSAFPPGVYQHEELCLYSLFDSLGRLPEARSVWKRYWEPLLQSTGTKKSLSRLELAEALIVSDFNAKLCSEKLHLHYNTVRNYIDDLERHLDVKVGDQHHRLGITLAFYIDRYMYANT